MLLCLPHVMPVLSLSQFVPVVPVKMLVLPAVQAFMQMQYAFLRIAFFITFLGILRVIFETFRIVLLIK